MEQEQQCIQDALNLASLDLPDSPRIVKLDWDYYEDTSGEEAIEVTVVFDRSTTDKEIATGPIYEMKGTILDSLRKHNVTLFPYFRYMREDEYEALRQER